MKKQNEAILVRCPELIKRELERIAKEQNRSLSAQIVFMLKRNLAEKVFKREGASA